MIKTSVPISEHGEPPRGNSNIKVCVWGDSQEEVMARYDAACNKAREIGDYTSDEIGVRWRVCWMEEVGLAEVVKFPWRRNKKGK